MQLHRLWLSDFRNYERVELELSAGGLTVVTGANGEGKTNLLEAMGWLATGHSFRGAPPESMIRVGATRAVVRAEGDRHGHDLLLEGELVAGGRSRLLVNRQPARAIRDRPEALRVTVFSPDDLALIKDGPAERRRFLDDLLVDQHPRWSKTRSDVERALRQRTTLLRQVHGHLSGEDALTLDVWDERLAEAGEALALGRVTLLEQLTGPVAEEYQHLAGATADVTLTYVAPWLAPEGPGLAAALASARADDLRRAACTVGPHRDELAMSVNGMPSRTHTSQGEQRCLAIALRLAGHRVVADGVASPPIVLLDDVFSELDHERSSALVAHLPPAQAILTTAGPIPADAHPDLVLQVKDGSVIGP